MRDIKFRAWDIGNKEMQVVERMWIPKNKPLIGVNTEKYSIGLNYLNGEHKKEFELMQYTGCKDMNDKEIYEGDIIQFEWEEDSCWGNEGTYRGYVQHDDGGYEVVYINRQRYTPTRGGRHPNSKSDELQSFIRWTSNCNIKVLGNIYKNPELLDGK